MNIHILHKGAGSSLRRLPTLLALSLLPCLLLACRGELGWKWAPKDVIQPPSSSDSPDAAAEVLFLEHTYYTEVEDDFFTQRKAHLAVKIHSEAALDAANQQFWLSKGEKLLFYRARSIAPDGRIEVIDENAFMIAEEAFEEGETARLVAARVPNVEVGSTIEVIFATEYAGYHSQLDTRVSMAYPIRKYRLDITHSANMESELDVWNFGVKSQRANLGPMKRLTLSATNLPAIESDWATPSSSVDEAFWYFRIKRIHWGRYTRKVKQNWTALMRSTIDKYFHKEDWRAGLDAKIDPSSCNKDKECIANLALAKTHEMVELKEWGTWTDRRPLGEVVDLGSGTPTEKNLILLALLRDAGVNAKLAFVNRKFTRRFEENIPHRRWFNSMIVVIARKGDDLFVDASCEHCTAGEIPRSLADADALVFWRKGDKRKSALVKVKGSPVRPAEERWRGRVTAAPDGTLAVTSSTQYEQHAATERFIGTRKFTNEEYADACESGLDGYLPGATAIVCPRLECDRTGGRCEKTLSYELPEHAPRIGAETYLVADLMPPRYSTALRDLERKRDIVLPHDRVLSQTLTVAIPRETRVIALPESFQISAPGLEVSLSVQQAESEVILTRTLTFTAGHYSKDDDDAMREALDAWRGVRRSALRFRRIEPEEPAPSSPTAL